MKIPDTCNGRIPSLELCVGHQPHLKHINTSPKYPLESHTTFTQGLAAAPKRPLPAHVSRSLLRGDADRFYGGCWALPALPPRPRNRCRRVASDRSSRDQGSRARRVNDGSRTYSAIAVTCQLHIGQMRGICRLRVSCMTAHPCRRATVVKPVADPDDEALIGPPLERVGRGGEEEWKPVSVSEECST